MLNKNLLIGALAIGMTVSLCAADAEKTIKGDGLCAKCELKEAKECQNAIRVTQDGKKVVYYVANNDVSKAFHKNVCSSVQKVKATGTVKKDGEKLVLTATKIELDK